MLEQCCNHSKQCRNNVATLCCAKNRRCESSRLVSPFRLCATFHTVYFIFARKFYTRTWKSRDSGNPLWRFGFPYVRVNKVKRMYRRSRVYVKVEPPGFSYIASISFTQVDFLCDRAVKFLEIVNPPRGSNTRLLPPLFTWLISSLSHRFVFNLRAIVISICETTRDKQPWR